MIVGQDADINSSWGSCLHTLLLGKGIASLRQQTPSAASQAAFTVRVSTQSARHWRGTAVTCLCFVSIFFRVFFRPRCKPSDQPHRKFVSEQTSADLNSQSKRNEYPNDYTATWEKDVELRYH